MDEELSLDDLEIQKLTPELKEKLEKLTNLQDLSLNNCGLASLKNFPNLPNLNRLEIGENEFPAIELVHLAGLKELETLDLHECQIESIDDLAPLKDLPSLYVLDISLTGLAAKENFREEIFKAFPQLGIINGVDKNG